MHNAKGSDRTEKQNRNKSKLGSTLVNIILLQQSHCFSNSEAHWRKSKIKKLCKKKVMVNVIVMNKKIPHSNKGYIKERNKHVWRNFLTIISLFLRNRDNQTASHLLCRTVTQDTKPTEFRWLMLKSTSKFAMNGRARCCCLKTSWQTLKPSRSKCFLFIVWVIKSNSPPVTLPVPNLWNVRLDPVCGITLLLWLMRRSF